MKRYLAAALLAGTLNAFSQNEIYLNEGFEHDGSLPDGWTQIYLGNINEKPKDLAWEAKEGGAKPAGSEVPKPEHAHDGEYNARLYYLSVEHMYSMYLASPVINFENAHKPLLTFWYSQYKDRASATDSSEIDNFEISLYYRILESVDTTWQKIRDYQSPTDDDEPWKCDSIWLPEIMTGQKKIQIAFLGKTKTLGHGCCLDDIKIEETQITNKYVGNITATHPTTDIIPTSSDDNPILKLRVQILGNSGVFNLNSLTAIVTQLKQKGNTLESTNAIKTNGVKLYYTENDIFTTDNLLATTSVVNGKATFNNVLFDMPAGYNYLWITCDIDDDNEHRFRNVKVDMKIEPESINIGGLKYPASTLNPAGDRTINESIFVDDFEDESRTNDQWPHWEGEFERAIPQGLGGNGANPDPTYAHGGNWIIGTDITGNGYNPGGIEIGVSSDECYVETKPFDCYYYKGISLIFYRWLNICDLDTAYVSVSTDEGATWENVWTSTSTILNKSWTYQNLDLKNIADRTPNIKLRFSLGSSSNEREQSTLAYSGWNIDDVALVGTFVYMDAAATAIVYPKTDCGLNKVKPVIRIKNAGFNKIETPFTARYSIDGGNTWVSETVTTHIEREDSIEYQFNTEADLSVYGWYNICAEVELNDDEDTRNNTTQKRIISLPNINLPYAENFSTYGYWYSEDETWQYTKPENATYCWATKPGNSICTLESPCFDMSDVQKPIIEFKLKGNSYSTDGLALYYSTDNGHETWNLVPAYPTAYPHECWKWYNEDNIDALSSAGWSGDIDNWTRYMQLLPDDVGGKNSVKLKFVFKAEYADYNFAIDDIRMYESPVDAGVVAIEPESKCHLLKEQPITITIKNFGNRAITPADSIIASVTINDKTTFTDTFFVAENVAKQGVFEHTFSETYDMWYKMPYKMVATTLITGDTLLFINPSNDSFTTTANVLGEPQYDLGADIGTMSPESFAIAAEKTKNGKFDQYNWFYADSIKDNGDFNTVETNWILSGLKRFETNEKEYYCYIKVKVKGQECYEKDSVKIIHSHYDVGIAEETSVLTPETFCGNKGFENKIKVTVKNYSTEFLVEKDSTISICYQIKDADGKLTTVAEDTTLEANFEANATFDYTFKQQPKFEFYGDQQISYFTLIYADLHHENDTITKDITVWAPPTADLGADSVLTANPKTTPGTLTTELISGAKYKWNDTGEPTLNNNTFTIPNDTTALYKVEVTDLHNCATVADSVQIVSDNWVLAELISPTDNCDPQNGLKIKVRIENNSDNLYPTGYKIPATIKFNGNTFNEVITLSENEADSLGTYSQFEHTFDTEIDMPEIGAYILNIRINPEHDINRNDNTINQEIDIWGTPRLDIGPDTIFTLRPDTIRFSIGSQFTRCHWWEDDKYQSEDLTYAPSYNKCCVYAINEHECYAEEQKTDKYAPYHDDTESGYCASDTVVIIKMNIDIQNIESPIAACDIESFNFVKLTLRNSGLDIIQNGTQLPIMIKVDNNAPVRKEYVIQSPFEPCEASETETDITAIIPFDFNFNKNLTYPVTAWLDWNLDRFHKNDTISTVVSQYPTPEPFTLGDDIYTTNPDTVILTAPQNYYNYSWFGGQSNTNTLAVSYIGTRTYTVKVSNQYGCSYYDSLVVALTHPQIDITSLGFNEDLCEDDNLSTISFTLNNIGEDIIAKGSQIDIEYSIDGADTVSETYKVANTLNSGESVTIAFKQQADFRSAANHALNITARIADTVAVSSKDYTVKVHESPKVSLGKDVSTFEQSVTLSAGAGFSSYLWNTGATSDKIVVENDGDYWVTATNDYGCKNSDTINVRMIPATITIYELTNPKSDCSLTDEPITINIINNGSNTIDQGSTLDIICAIDNDKTDSIRYTLPFDFTPGMTFFKTFDGLLTTDRAGIHTLTFTIIIENVVINSSTFEFEIYGTPDFAFENDEISVSKYPYTLAPTSSLTDATYKWNNGSETNAIEVTANGTYTLTVTDKHNCSATKSVTVKQNATGISNSTIADIAVYPNPANNIVNIDFDGQITNDCQILIANASGRIIFASRQTSDIMQIDVDDWAQGIYFIKITNNNENRVIKFVKK